MTDETKRLVSPLAPTIRVVGDAGGFVVFMAEAVYRPCERAAARHGVLVGFVGNVDEFAAMVDSKMERSVSLPVLAHRIFLSIRYASGSASPSSGWSSTRHTSAVLSKPETTLSTACVWNECGSYFHGGGCASERL